MAGRNWGGTADHLARPLSGGRAFLLLIVDCQLLIVLGEVSFINN